MPKIDKLKINKIGGICVAGKREIARESKRTLDACYNMLSKYGTCMMVRPTGFGKSYIMAQLSKKYKKSLYVYPTEIISVEMQENYKEVLSNTSFISYRKLLEQFKRGKAEQTILNSGYDIIMFDEVHYIGSRGFKQLYKILEEARNRGIKLLGATATPDRTDEFDYETIVFRNKRVYEYSLHDCIQNGIMYKPYYIQAMDKSSELAERLREGDKVGKKEIELANIINAENIIRKHIKVIYRNVNYLKFIVFFSSIESLHERRKEVVEWFEEAFPKLNVNSIVVSSEAENRKNISEISNLRERDKTIDIIMCIDMLNMGYHIDDLTGVVMIRSTKSSIVYWQQIGRALSIKASKPAIIFDFVDNMGMQMRPKKNISDRIDESIGRGRGIGHRGSIEDAGLEIMDLNLIDYVADYRDLMNSLQGHKNSKRDDMIEFLYKNRHMPQFKIGERLGISKGEVAKVLSSRGIKLIDESVLKNVYDARKLYLERGDMK